MNWYLVKLVYQVMRQADENQPQFDEQWRLIRADEVEWAYEKASTLGRLEESSFLNHRQEQVLWKFVAVAEIYGIGELTDGFQLFSKTEEPSDTQAYLHQVNVHAQKSLALACQAEHTTQIAML
jgi:hypothetical protein